MAPSRSTLWALREPETLAQRENVEAFLSSRELLEITRFAAYHDDRLNTQALSGRFDRVVFADLDALLAGVWKGCIRLDEWFKAGVRIEILDSPVSPNQLNSLLAQVYDSHARYQKVHRRRQILAAIALGALALAAMASMIWIIPRMR